MTVVVEPTIVDKSLSNVGAKADDLENKGTSDLGIPKAPVDDGAGKKPSKADLDEVHTEKTPAEKKAIADKATADAAAKAKEAEEALAGEREAWDGQYVTIDNPGAQAVIELLKESNVDPKEANSFFEAALKTGDISKVDWAGLEKKIGPAKTKLAKIGVEQYYNTAVKETNATVAAAYEITGGEENWVTIRTWAQATEKSDKEFAKLMPDYRKALDAGGWAAKKAVEALKEAYNKAPNNKGLGVAKLLQGDKLTPVVGEVIRKADYLTQMKALHEKGASQSEIAALRLRRNQSRAQGIN